LIDNAEKETGLLEEHFDFLLPKTVTDPAARKPLDWDDRREVPDVTDVKPEGHDDVPEAVTDPDARKPEGWHDDDDGEWEAPLVKNPLFKGPWVQKQIDNPNFAGTWTAPEIPNPAYVPSADLYLFHDLRYVGFELWQVTAGSIFDNVLVTDDAQYAFAAADAFLENSKLAETKMFELATAKQKTENEAEAKRLQEEAETNAAAENTFGDYEHSAEDEPGKDEL
jgi:calreticulin